MTSVIVRLTPYRISSLIAANRAIGPKSDTLECPKHANAHTMTQHDLTINQSHWSKTFLLSLQVISRSDAYPLRPSAGHFAWTTHLFIVIQIVARSCVSRIGAQCQSTSIPTFSFTWTTARAIQNRKAQVVKRRPIESRKNQATCSRDMRSIPIPRCLRRRVITTIITPIMEFPIIMAQRPRQHLPHTTTLMTNTIITTTGTFIEFQ